MAAPSNLNSSTSTWSSASHWEILTDRSTRLWVTSMGWWRALADNNTPKMFTSCSNSTIRTSTKYSVSLRSNNSRTTRHSQLKVLSIDLPILAHHSLQLHRIIYLSIILHHSRQSLRLFHLLAQTHHSLRLLRIINLSIILHHSLRLRKILFLAIRIHHFLLSERTLYQLPSSCKMTWIKTSLATLLCNITYLTDWLGLKVNLTILLSQKFPWTRHLNFSNGLSQFLPQILIPTPKLSTKILNRRSLKSKNHLKSSRSNNHNLFECRVNTLSAVSASSTSTKMTIRSWLSQPNASTVFIESASKSKSYPVSASRSPSVAKFAKSRLGSTKSTYTWLKRKKMKSIRFS